MTTIKGAGTALITPFNQDGSVDYASLCNVVEKNIAGGIDFLCVLGTTAETPTLSDAEQREIRASVVRQAAGRVPLLLGFGGNNTATMVEKLESEDFDGFDALLVVTPFYNKPNQEGLYQHYKAIAAHSPKPLFIYNVPGRTGVNILPGTVLRIAADCPNVVGIKEASGNVDQIIQLIDSRPDGFVVLSGDDALTHELMEHGADGVVSVLSNELPAAICAIVHDRERAAEVDESVSKYYGPLFKEGNPVGIKAMMSLNGEIDNVLRLPLVCASDALMEIFRQL